MTDTSANGALKLTAGGRKISGGSRFEGNRLAVQCGRIRVYVVACGHSCCCGHATSYCTLCTCDDYLSDHIVQPVVWRKRAVITFLCSEPWAIFEGSM